MSTQQFCLKWNNYQSNMSDVFLSMLNNENMVDVTLACDGQNIKAHKMVLAACSPYFQTLFQTNPCKHPIVILKDVRFLDLRAIIDFMYRGEVNVGQDQLAALLKTAETLKVKGLAEVTEKQARGQVTSQHQQQPLFGTAVASNLSNILPPTPQTKKKRKRNNKNKGNDQEHHCPDPSESDEDGSAAKRTSEGIKGSRLNATQRMITAKQDTSPVEQMESSRILEQSMATAEVVGEENGQEGHSFVSPLDDEAMGHTLFDETATLGSQATDAMMISAPGSSGGQATIIVLSGQGASNLNTMTTGTTRIGNKTTTVLAPMTPSGLTSGLGSYPLTPSSSSTTTPSTPGGSSGLGLTPGGSNSSSNNVSPNKTFDSKYECDLCKLKFASNYNLKRHSRTHDATRPRWQCNYCEKSFTRRDSLPKHINFVHKDQVSVKEEHEEVSLEATSAQESPGGDHVISNH